MLPLTYSEGAVAPCKSMSTRRPKPLQGFTNTYAKSVTVALVQCRKLIGIQQGTGRQANFSSTYEVGLTRLENLFGIDLCEFTRPKTVWVCCDASLLTSCLWCRSCLWTHCIEPIARVGTRKGSAMGLGAPDVSARLEDPGTDVVPPWFLKMLSSKFFTPWRAPQHPQEERGEPGLWILLHVSPNLHLEALKKCPRSHLGAIGVDWWALLGWRKHAFEGGQRPFEADSRNVPALSGRNVHCMSPFELPHSRLLRKLSVRVWKWDALKLRFASFSNMWPATGARLQIDLD